MDHFIPMSTRRIVNDFKVYFFTITGEHQIKSINKLQLMQMAKLHSRDIRLHLTNQPTGIFIHDYCIIINMFHIKLIILSDFCIFYDLESPEEIDHVIHNLQEKIKSTDNESRFEFFVLESILSDVCNNIQNEYQDIKTQTETLLASLLSSPKQRKSKDLLPIKNNLKKLQVTTKSIYDSMTNLLDNEEDLMKMYLTEREKDSLTINEKKNQIGSKEKININIDEMEDLIESYYYEIDKLVNRLHIIENNIDETDDTVSLMLDISRNRIMISDLWLNFLTLIISSGTLVTGLFGMNIENRLEDHNYAFHIIWSLILISIILLVIFFKYKTRKIKI